MLAASEHSHIHTSKKTDRQAVHWTSAELSEDRPESISKATWWLLFKYIHAVFFHLLYIILYLCLWYVAYCYMYALPAPSTLRVCHNCLLIFSACQMWKIKVFLLFLKGLFCYYIFVLLIPFQ